VCDLEEDSIGLVMYNTTGLVGGATQEVGQAIAQLVTDRDRKRHKNIKKRQLVPC
jgi:hypothetical protein